jgi:hypothetical protein
MNKLYGIAEQAQAYVYDRFDVAEETPDVMRMNQRYAVLWTALVIGAALAVPAQTARKWICIALAGAVMVVFAWFGLLPAAAGMAVVLAAVLLLAGEGTVFTRDRILQQIWGFAFDGENRTVDVHSRTLRTKLGECGDLIETVRGVGYRIGGDGR